MSSVLTRSAVALALCSTLAACSSPTSPGSQSALTLTGSWSGNVGGGAGGGRALRVAWTATQLGSAAFGVATLTSSPALTDIRISGNLSASVSGTQLTLSFNAPAGTVPGSSQCSVTATGNGVATGQSVSGMLDVTFTSCDSLNLSPPVSDILVLNRQ